VIINVNMYNIDFQPNISTNATNTKIINIRANPCIAVTP